MRLNEFTNDDLSEGVAGPKKCWPGHRKVGTQPGTGKNKGKRVNDCEKIKKEDDVEESQIDEIDRRGFLKGMGAAAVAGAAGGAKAAQDIGKEGQRKVMDMMGLWYACQNYTNTKYTVSPDICQNAKQSINKFIRNFAGGKEYLNGWYANMHDFEKQEIAKGKLSALTSNVLRDPNYAKQIIRNFDSLSAFDESVNQGVAEDQQENVNENELSRLRKLSGISIIKEEIEQQFNLIEEMVEALAEQHGVDAEQIWEDFESVDDYELLRESAAWQTSKGKSKSGGLNAKGVASYRRENPGSKLQMAVTTKPSKLKKGSKAAKRRKSFCARMSGVNGPMKKPNGKPTRKALALRKWNC